MSLEYNKTLIPFAKSLRRNATPQENHLWYDFLNRLPARFNRQKVIGPYIVDFYCASSKLVVELDGSQHYEDAGIAADAQRDAFLAEQGLQVLRYTNVDIHRNFNGVCEDILKHL